MTERKNVPRKWHFIIKTLCAVVGFQSVAGVSAATTVDVLGPTSHLSRSEPTAALTKTRPDSGVTDRLSGTHPVTGKILISVRYAPVHPGYLLNFECVAC